MPGDLGDVLVVPEFDEEVEDLAFQLLHASHGHLEKVACAASGVQHLGLGELGVEGLDMSSSFVGLAFFDQRRGCTAHPVPVGSERPHDRRTDQPLDIGAGRVVGAELGPLHGVDRPFQQSAEDGWLDLVPPVAPGL